MLGAVLRQHSQCRGRSLCFRHCRHLTLKRLILIGLLRFSSLAVSAWISPIHRSRCRSSRASSIGIASGEGEAGLDRVLGWGEPSGRVKRGRPAEDDREPAPPARLGWKWCRAGSVRPESYAPAARRLLARLASERAMPLRQIGDVAAILAELETDPAISRARDSCPSYMATKDRSSHQRHRT